MRLITKSIDNIKKKSNEAQFILNRNNLLMALCTNPFLLIRRNLYKEILKNSNNLQGRMMDFGCGAKPYKKLFSKVNEYIGVDVELSGHCHENEDIDVYYDGKTLPFEDNSFDSIFSSEVFEHVSNLEEILNELNRVLKPEGMMLVTVPFVWNEHEAPYDYVRYTSYGIKRILRSHGFVIKRLNKSASYIEMIYQLKAEYVRYEIDKIFPDGRVGRNLKRILIIPIMIKGIIMNWIFPENDSLYGNNVVLCQKIENICK